MRISVILPVLNEEKTVGSTLQALKRLEPDEIMAVDGGSTDRTREICESLAVSVISSCCGRARQMNQGARQATGDVLLFLHADTRLPPSALIDVRAALQDPKILGGRFDVKLDDDGWMFRVIGTMISFRSRLSRVCTGDQAIFVRRDVFNQLGGYPDVPLLEDVAFSQALKRRGAVACLRSQVMTSARRWELEGVWRTIFKMWALRALFLLGISPLRLKRYYDDAR